MALIRYPSFEQPPRFPCEGTHKPLKSVSGQLFFVRISIHKARNTGPRVKTRRVCIICRFLY